MMENDINALVKNSLLNEKGTANNRTTLSESFSYPITDCNSFVEAVQKKFGYATIEETKHAISRNNTLIRLMFSIA